jgi:hypothetical protein
MRKVRQGVVALAVAAFGAVAMVAPSAPVSAGTYPPLPPDVVIDYPTDTAGNNFIEPGSPFTLTFGGFPPGSEVYITIDTGTAAISSQALITLGPFIVAADGTVTIEFPALPAGTFEMVLTVDGVSYTIPLIIGAVIPEAGGDAFSLVRPAIALLLTGAVIVLVAQRRRQPAAAADAPVTVGGE